MSLRSRVLGWLDRGPAPLLDPDEPVEVEYSWLHEGPLLLSYLESEGIDAQGYEAYAVESLQAGRRRMRILVRRRDQARAIALLQEYRQHLRDAP